MQSSPEEQSRLRHRESRQNVRLWRAGGYVTYLWQSLRTTSLWSLCMQAILLARRARLVLFLFRALSLLWTLLEAGALLLITLLLGGLLLPLILSLLPGLFLATAIAERRSLAFFSKELPKNRVAVLFLPPTLREQLPRQAHALAAEGWTVLLVNGRHTLFSSRQGIGGYILSHRRLAKRIFLLRRHAFFCIHKKGLLPENTAVLF